MAAPRCASMVENDPAAQGLKAHGDRSQRWQCELDPAVRVAGCVEHQESAGTRPEDLAAACASGARLVVPVVDFSRADPGGKLLLDGPVLVPDLAEGRDVVAMH